ncbi:MAG: TPM domain-containing protein [bacterium]|nr:TPM domain-containing protein [bacterium]
MLSFIQLNFWKTQRTFLLVFIVTTLFQDNFANIVIPDRPKAFVNDFANIIHNEKENSIEQLCRTLERQLNGVEIAVVTLKELEGETIENVAFKFFDAWKIGKKGKDNGLLFIVAEKERKVKIEVGYGLEPILPDGLIGEFLDRGFVNTFRITQNYGDAIYNTISMIGLRIAKVEGIRLDSVQMNVSPKKKAFRFPVWLLFLLFLLLFGRRRKRFISIGPWGGFGGGGFGGFGGSSGGFGGFGGGLSGGGGASRSF